MLQLHHHTSRALMLAMFQSAVSLVGCAAESPEVARETQALAALDDLGFDTEHAAFHTFENRELVRIDDINFDVGALLRGDYGTPEPAEVIDKGYKHTSSGAPVSSANSKNIKLVFATGTQAPSEAVKTVFRNAAYTWTNATYSGQTAANLSISQNNTGSSITVRRIAGSAWPTGSPCDAGTWACVDAFPAAGKPSANIYYKDDINPFGNANQCDWTSSTLANMALHELGHAIGFTHPGERTHVSGTQSCGDTKNCQYAPPYWTVMSGSTPISAYPNCQTAWGGLQTDDRDLVTTVY